MASRESYYDVPKKLDMSAEPKKVDMSAEIEKQESKEEDVSEPLPTPKRPIYKQLLDHWQLGFKILELVSF